MMPLPIVAAASHEQSVRARFRDGLAATAAAFLALLLLTGGSAVGQDDVHPDADDVAASKVRFDAFFADLLMARAEANVAEGELKSATGLTELRSSLAMLAGITDHYMPTIQEYEPDPCWVDLHGASMGSIAAWHDFATAFVDAIDTGDSSLARDGRGDQLLATAAAADAQVELELQLVDCPWLPPPEASAP